MSSIKTQTIWICTKISNTVVHLPIYDIFVSGILCCVCLYAQKSRLTLMVDYRNWYQYWVHCCRIWSWSPVPCEKHGPRDSVDKNRGRRPRFLSLLRPEGHVFHTAWETMIKSYYSTLADWFFSCFIHINVDFSALKWAIFSSLHGCQGNRTVAMDWLPRDTNE